jgi:hypothetical protein
MNADIAARERALLALRERCDEALGVLAGESDPRVPDLGAHSEAINEMVAQLSALDPAAGLKPVGASNDPPIPPSPWPLRRDLEWPLVVMDLVAGYDVAIAGHREAVVRSESMSGLQAERLVRVLLRQIRRLETLRDYMEAAIGDYEEATMTRHTGEIPTIASGTLAP